jgi:hypothetical protein
MALTDYSYLDAEDASGREFPTHILPSKVKVTVDQPTLVSTTNSLTSQRRSLGAHRIELDYTYPPMSATDLMPFVAFFSAMQGQGKAFKLNAPKQLINDTVHIADTATHTVTASYSTGTREVVVNGFDADLDIAIRGGNMIQFSNHDKIYIVSADGGSDGSGNCRIRIEPALIENVTSSETLNTFSEDIPIHVIFASDKIEFDVDSALLYGFKVKFVEQWTN